MSNSAIFLKDAVYKVISAVDDLVLTTTWDGSPRQVITAPWAGKEEQHWKVKSNIKEGSPFYLIRNELIKNNVVSKEKNRSGNPHENSMVPTEWNLIPSTSNSAYFLLNNGIGFLKTSGSGSNISIETGGERDDAQHQWRFEYLFDIEK